MAYNVIVAVLDTLREDYSLGLDSLVSDGFVRYSNCIATSSWTLPSHASLFTGEAPSVHGIQYARSIHRRLRQLSYEKLTTNPNNILTMLAKRGYRTLGLSCNPMISPGFGYVFHDFKLFGSVGDISEISEGAKSRRSQLRRTMALAKRRKFRSLAAFVALQTHMEQRLGHVLGTHPLEKGSRYCVNEIRKETFDPPFFLFINLMESHEPYNWNEREDLGRYSRYCALLGKSYPFAPNWRARYPEHALLAIMRVISMLRFLASRLPQSLIVVTSDHGQLLGEGSRYGHGFFLDDELLRVPLYVKYPSGVAPLKQTGEFLSLTSIPDIVKYVLEGEPVNLGGNQAVAESVGPGLDILKLAKDSEESGRINQLYAHRVKLYTNRGSAVYNRSGNFMESLTGSLEKGEAQEYLDELPSFAEPKESDVAVPVSAEPFTKEDEETTRQRLRNLGYE